MGGVFSVCLVVPILLRLGNPLQVNFDETRYDDHVHVLVRQPAGKFFAEVADILSGPVLSDGEDTDEISQLPDSAPPEVSAWPVATWLSWNPLSGWWTQV